ncbi:hypothetical protein CMI47_04400 [Candidatus Pacearchaeota archaeon]|nr:hypothetical protein [Candidatus Pacearchaeota archaeon]
MSEPNEEVSSQEITKADGSKEVINRNNLGQFAKGISGNPAGRPKGSKSRTLIIKQAMEEALTRDAAEAFHEIVDTAIEMAKSGDKDMIKFVLGDVLKEARRADGSEEDSKKIGKIEITFSPFQGESTNAVQKVIDGEFEEIKGHTKRDLP